MTPAHADQLPRVGMFATVRNQRGVVSAVKTRPLFLPEREIGAGPARGNWFSDSGRGPVQVGSSRFAQLTPGRLGRARVK